MPTLEDKIVQRATVEVLNAIYKEEFRGFSYGFRPGRSPHEALDAVTVGIEKRNVNWVLEADIRGFFDAIDHAWLLKFIADFRGQKRTHTPHIPWLRLWVRKGDGEIVPPGNRGTRLLKGSFAQDRIVSPFVKMHHNPVGLHFELSPSFHELAIELFGLRFVKAMQLRGQPPVAPMRKNCQGHVHIHVEPHLTGETVEVKEIDADAEAILNTIASGVAGDEVSGTGVEVVGHKEGRLGMPQAVHSHLPYGASVPTEC